MARGRKKKTGPDIRQKFRGYYLVRIIDENKNNVYIPGVDWNYIVDLHRNKKIKFLVIETVNTPHYRPEDVTEEVLKKLAGDENG